MKYLNSFKRVYANYSQNSIVFKGVHEGYAVRSSCRSVCYTLAYSVSKSNSSPLSYRVYKHYICQTIQETKKSPLLINSLNSTENLISCAFQTRPDHKVLGFAKQNLEILNRDSNRNAPVPSHTNFPWIFTPISQRRSFFVSWIWYSVDIYIIRFCLKDDNFI